MQCRSLFVLSLVLPLVACGKKAEERGEQAHPPVATHSQWYRVEVAADRGDVPFLLEVQLPLQPKSTAQVANGEERISLAMTCEKTECKVHFSVFAAALELSFDSEESFIGTWRRSDYYTGGPVALSGTAVDGPGSENRYIKNAEPSVDVSGTWVLAIDGVGSGKAEFKQNEDGTVQGSMVPTNIGDLRYLDGRVEGTTLRLSTFNGQHAYNVELTVSADGNTLEGLWHFHTVWHYPVKGTRGAPPSLEALHTIRLKPGKTTLDIPELKALRGKPVIVDFYGTWCPACVDLMPVLVDLHSRYNERGLEVLSIAFEPSDDPKLVKQQVQRLKDRYDIPWESTIKDVDQRPIVLRNLENAEGFPVTAFVGRDGIVRGLHSGFVSAAAGEDHQKLLQKFETLTKRIVAPAGQGGGPEVK